MFAATILGLQVPESAGVWLAARYAPTHGGLAMAILPHAAMILFGIWWIAFFNTRRGRQTVPPLN
jgi:hypothetical protein